MSTTERKPFWIEDVRHAYRLLSVQISALGAAASGAFLMLDEAQRAAIFQALGVAPETGVAVAAFLTFTAGLLGRLKKQ